jgi:hypothetical protein
MIITCMVLAEAGLGRDCCGSCHSDDEDGYSGLCGISGLPDDLDADEYVCCSHVGRTFTPEELDAIREAARNHK